MTNIAFFSFIIIISKYKGRDFISIIIKEDEAHHR